jgi:predicted SAM-dependent methyltransferase
MNLIVCAGTRLKEGWTSHDVQGNVDIKCDFWDLPEHVKPESCDKIEFTHALEHFAMGDTLAVLHQLKTMLKEGGEIYIEVPNFYWHAEQIIQNPKNRQIVEYAFGGQLDKYDFHYNGFTPEILAEDLREVGFTVMSLQPNSSIECTARK